MKYRLIEAEKAEHRISRLCTVLGVTRQGFYAWRRRGPSLRQLGDAELARLIVMIYDGSLQTYGAPRIQLELADEHDVHVGRKRVARLMRDLGIEGVSRRGKKQRTTASRSEGAAGTRPGRAPLRRRGAGPALARRPDLYADARGLPICRRSRATCSWLW
jgi:putative transposase